jgi:glycosyltransferase involved in cell wall biosynthesis
VIDDASSDDTCARVDEIAASDSRVVVLRQKENKGAYAARNEGLKHVYSEFIANHELGIAEALLLGLDVIATGHGGNEDFCRKAGARLVAHKDISLKPKDLFPEGII